MGLNKTRSNEGAKALANAVVMNLALETIELEENEGITDGIVLFLKTALTANTMDLPDASEASNQDAPNDAKEEL